MTRGLRKRQTPFVQVPSSTIRDKRLSFRARGILAYLLDMPPAWDVRSEVIAAAGTEGREAVRTALRELGKHGYYRLERRRLVDGTFEMGTAISEEPVVEWAAEYAEFDGKAVIVIEQEDGSFKVKRKDGSLVDDGFGAHPGNGMPPADHESAGHTGDRIPGSGLPDFGAPGSGPLGAFNRGETQDREKDPDSFANAQESAPGEQSSLLGDEHPTPAPRPNLTRSSRSKKQRTAEEQLRFTQATEVAQWWWDECDNAGVPKIGKSAGSTGFPGLVQMIESALADDYSQKEIAYALRKNPTRRFPPLFLFEQALMAVRGIASAPAGPGQQRMATSDLRVSQVQSMMDGYEKAAAEGRLDEWFATPEPMSTPNLPAAPTTTHRALEGGF